MKKINTKIPGLLPPPPKSEIDGKITNLQTKSLTELNELRYRQLKLLANKSFIQRLPDKGAKIQALYDKIELEIKSKLDEEHTCNLLDKMNLTSEAVERMEWKGRNVKKDDTYLDSDDDSEAEDVLHILSQSTTQEKKIKVLPPKQASITPEDLISIGEIPHVKYIVEKTEVTNHQKTTGHFKPYKTTKSDVHNPEKEMNRKKHRHWEVTAATPPPTKHGPAKVLSIQESLQLQKEYNTHLKEVESRHAAEKLLLRTEIKMPDLPNNLDKFGKYREVDSDDSEASDPEGSDKEVHDDEPERGGVVFTVMN